jgi:hypothetical protein
VLQVMLLVLAIALLHRLQKDLAQADGRDLNVDCATFAAELCDRIRIATGEDGDLPSVAAHLLDAEDGFKLRRWISMLCA